MYNQAEISLNVDGLDETYQLQMLIECLRRSRGIHLLRCSSVEPMSPCFCPADEAGRDIQGSSRPVEAGSSCGGLHPPTHDSATQSNMLIVLTVTLATSERPITCSAVSYDVKRCMLHKFQKRCNIYNFFLLLLLYRPHFAVTMEISHLWD